MSTSRWEDVRSAVRTDMALREMSQTEYARGVLEIDPGTFRDFLRGTRDAQSKTATRIEQGLGWEAGTIANYIAGRVDRLPEGVDDETPSASWSEALGVDVSDLPLPAQQEVEAAARLAALERSRKLRAELVDVKSPSVILGPGGD